MVSGEDIAVQQALSVLPWAKSVVVDVRGILLTLARKFYGIKHTHFAPEPNAEGAVTMD